LDALQRLKKDMPSPSSFAMHKHKGRWAKILAKNPNSIVCYRDVKEGFALSVCLLNESFYRFMFDLDNIAVTAEDCNFVMKLTESMCGSFSIEEDRRDKFIQLFHEYSGRRLCCVELELANTSMTDGSHFCSKGALYCNLEVKVEKGAGGGDPYMQCIAWYIKGLPLNAINVQCPCFSLELCGTAFSINGLLTVFTARHCQYPR
jgi:hypothetical protein